MKNTVFAVFMIVAVVIGTGIGSWRYILSAPRYYDADGGTMWKRQMTLVEQKTFLPYVTQYNVMWNGISNDEVIVQNSWIEFVVWNGHGVNSIKVYEQEEGAERLVYPTDKDIRSMNFLSSDGLILGGSITFGTIKNDNRYIIFGVKPPSEGTDNLRIVVTDVHGNVTQDTITISSIRR